MKNTVAATFIGSILGLALIGRALYRRLGQANGSDDAGGLAAVGAVTQTRQTPKEAVGGGFEVVSGRAAHEHPLIEPGLIQVSPDTSSSKTARAKGWQRTLLSLVTLAWLACQIWAVLSFEFETWPITELEFFSDGVQEDVDVELTGFTRDGRRLVAMTPSEFGLEPQQLELWLMEQQGQFPDARDPRDLETLAELARIWNEGHAGEEEEVVAVRLRLEGVPLPGGSEPSGKETVLVWSAR